EGEIGSTGKTGIVNNAFGFRPLNGEEYAVERIDRNLFAGSGFVQMLDIGLGITRIGDDHEAVVAKTRDDEIVQNAALVIKEESVFRLARLQHGRVERAGFRQ